VVENRGCDRRVEKKREGRGGGEEKGLKGVREQEGGEEESIGKIVGVGEEKRSGKREKDMIKEEDQNMSERWVKKN
jgi:hypothetical protein